MRGGFDSHYPLHNKKVKKLMSKYNNLWQQIDASFKSSGEETIKLSFEKVQALGGVKVDHSFLTYKKELEPYGYKVDKISLKQQTITFIKIK